MKIGMLLAVLALLAGCSSSAGKPKGTPAPLLVNGTVQAYDTAAIAAATASGSKACTTTGAYAGAHQGAQVKVVDSANKTVAVGTLSAGTVSGTEIKGNKAYCSFSWTATVPLGSQYFRLVLAGQSTQQTPAQLAGGPVITFGPAN